MNNYLVQTIAAASCAACCLLGATRAAAQYPGGYGAYYNQNVGMRGAESSSRYLYDKYFYHRSTVSPYLSLSRPGTDFATSYQTFVRPELERRQAAETANRAYIQQRKLEGKVGETRFPGAGFVGGTINDAILKPVPAVKTTPSSYYNHWYGGWANR